MTEEKEKKVMAKFQRGQPLLSIRLGHGGVGRTERGLEIIHKIQTQYTVQSNYHYMAIS